MPTIGATLSKTLIAAGAALHQSYGTHFLDGEEDYAGHRLKVWFKNEHHFAWIDDNVVATSPDLIMSVDRTTGLPVTNEEIREVMRLTVFAARTLCNPYGTPARLRTLGPRSLGFDVEYVPVEEHVRQPVGAAVPAGR